jgi:hypothetical protein
LTIALRLMATAASSRSGHEALAPPGTRRRTRLHGWFRGRRCWIGSGVWPVRPRVTSNVITPRSSADLIRPPLVVVLDSPFVAADYAEQISHGSPTSASVWMALTLYGRPSPSPSVLTSLFLLTRSTRDQGRPANETTKSAGSVIESERSHPPGNPGATRCDHQPSPSTRARTAATADTTAARAPTTSGPLSSRSRTS